MSIYVLALDSSGGSSLVAVVSPISASSRPIFLQPRGIQTLLQHTYCGYYIATVDTLLLLLWIFLRYLARGIWRPRIVAIAGEVAFRFNILSCS